MVYDYGHDSDYDHNYDYDYDYAYEYEYDYDHICEFDSGLWLIYGLNFWIWQFSLLRL